jgi:hypothetical protein
MIYILLQASANCGRASTKFSSSLCLGNWAKAIRLQHAGKNNWLLAEKIEICE